MSSPDYLFNDPNVDISPDGDVVPSPGDVDPINPFKAAAELRQDHPFEIARVGQLPLSEEVVIVDTLETEEEAYGLKTSNAALQHRIAADTRILGLEKTTEIKSKIQENLDR